MGCRFDQAIHGYKIEFQSQTDIRTGEIFILFRPHAWTHPNQSAIEAAHVVLYAHDHCNEALSALFRYVNNKNIGGEYSIIQLQIHEDDPANESLKGLTGISVYSEIHLFTDTLQFAREIQNTVGLVHLEFPNYI